MKVSELIDKLKEYDPNMTAQIEHIVWDEDEEEISLAIKNNAGDTVSSIYLY